MLSVPSGSVPATEEELAAHRKWRIKGPIIASVRHPIRQASGAEQLFASSRETRSRSSVDWHVVKLPVCPAVSERKGLTWTGRARCRKKSRAKKASRRLYLALCLCFVARIVCLRDASCRALFVAEIVCLKMDCFGDWLVRDLLFLSEECQSHFDNLLEQCLVLAPV